MAGKEIMADPTKRDVADLSFEEALAELEKIVRELEQGKSGLDDAIQAYERGAELKRHCEKKLNDAKAKIDRISLGPAGPQGLEPADIA
jgi:exodeoxyribonuclease VII small subunit